MFGRDPDSILSLTPHEERDCFTLEATLRNSRQSTPWCCGGPFRCLTAIHCWTLTH